MVNELFCTFDVYNTINNAIIATNSFTTFCIVLLWNTFYVDIFNECLVKIYCLSKYKSVQSAGLKLHKYCQLFNSVCSACSYSCWNNYNNECLSRGQYSPKI